MHPYKYVCQQLPVCDSGEIPTWNHAEATGRATLQTAPCRAGADARPVLEAAGHASLAPHGNAPRHAATAGLGTPCPLLPVLEIRARLAAGLAPSTPCTALAQPSSCTMRVHPPTVLHAQYGLNTSTANICLLLHLVPKIKVVPCKDCAQSHAPAPQEPQLARCRRQLHRAPAPSCPCFGTACCGTAAPRVAGPAAALLPHGVLWTTFFHGL